MEEKAFLDLLKTDLKPALGVTEPGAIALASATAQRAVGGDLKEIELELDAGLYKNAFACAIPGTQAFGIEMAALLGVLAGDPGLELEVLKNITDQDVEAAELLKRRQIVKTKIKEDLSSIHISCTVTTDQGWGRALVVDRHANIVLVETNEGVVFEKEDRPQTKKSDFNLKKATLDDLLGFTNTVSWPDIEFVLVAVQMNKELAKSGQSAGMGVASALGDLNRSRLLANDLFLEAQILTARAMDARLGGIPLPAMSISGSGSHGIIASLPIAAVADHKKIGLERLARALAFSFLITNYIKEFSGRLSAFCGCAVAAGTGAAAGIVHLLDGTIEQITSAINNMAANITGMVCDGANYGCALKAATASHTAVMSALFALNNVAIPAGSGIVGKTAEETMQNMGRIATPGMTETEKVILQIISEQA